jgi:hypothetical protein
MTEKIQPKVREVNAQYLKEVMASPDKRLKFLSPCLKLSGDRYFVIVREQEGSATQNYCATLSETDFNMLRQRAKEVRECQLGKMTGEQPVQVREWKEGETLEDLAVGDVAKFFYIKSGEYFDGAYDGRDGNTFIVYSRENELENKSVVKWFIVEKGRAQKGFLFFNLAPRSRRVYQQTESEEYQNINDFLISKGL